MVCSVCASDTPQAGCPTCALSQPTLFPVDPPTPPSAAKLANAILKERERIAAIEMKQGRVAALKVLGRPVYVALVGCSKTKVSVPSPAKDFYTGDLFKLAVAFAQRSADEVFIVSAKHGLVPLDEELRPYDRTIADLTRKDRLRWAEGVITSLRRRLPGLRLNIIVLAGKDYADPLIRATGGTGWNCERPLLGKGIGQQKAWLKAMYEAVVRQPMSVHPPMGSRHG